MSPDEVRSVEFPDFVRYCNYSAKHPSLRDLVHAIAGSLGIEVPDGTKPRYMTGEELKAFVDRTGGKIEGIGHG
jgi:hypothetical protein